MNAADARQYLWCEERKTQVQQVYAECVLALVGRAILYGDDVEAVDIADAEDVENEKHERDEPSVERVWDQRVHLRIQQREVLRGRWHRLHHGLGLWGCCRRRRVRRLVCVRHRGLRRVLRVDGRELWIVGWHRLQIGVSIRI